MDLFSVIQVSILTALSLVLQRLNWDLVVDLLQEIHQDIVAVAVAVQPVLGKVQPLEMVEPEKSLQSLGHISVAVELAVLTLQMVELVESAAVVTVEMAAVIPAVMTELQILAAAADRWEMPVAVTEH